MTTTQITIIAALISSPLLFAVFENISSFISARFKYFGWQAVFLSGGQVYFGKINSVTKNEIKLTNIYYIRGDGKPPGKSLDEYAKNIELVKLGEELHGPTDTMYISKINIIFTESLKETGEVVKAIKEYELKNQKAKSSRTKSPK